MRDLIDRQAAIDALREYLINKRVPEDGTLTARLIENEVINKLPSAEPKTGRWEEAWVSGLDGVRRWSWRCSECGDEPYYFHDIHSLHYCPHCGAKMEVDNE